MVTGCQRFIAVDGLLLLVLLLFLQTGETNPWITVKGVGTVSGTSYGTFGSGCHGFIKVWNTLSQSTNSYITAGGNDLYVYEIAVIEAVADVSMTGSSFIHTDAPSYLIFWSTVKMADSSSIWMGKSSKFISGDRVAGGSLALTLGESASITLGASSTFNISNLRQLTLQIESNALIQLRTHASVLFNEYGESNLIGFESGSKLTIGEYSSFRNNEADFLQGEDSSLLLGSQAKMSNNGFVRLGRAAEIQTRDFVSIGIADGAGLNVDQSSSLRLDDYTDFKIDSRAKLTIIDGRSLRIQEHSVLHITAGMLCYAQADVVIPANMNYTITANSTCPAGLFCLNH